jgi:hypothetical protein
VVSNRGGTGNPTDPDRTRKCEVKTMLSMFLGCSEAPASVCHHSVGLQSSQKVCFTALPLCFVSQAISRRYKNWLSKIVMEYRYFTSTGIAGSFWVGCGWILNM